MTMPTFNQAVSRCPLIAILRGIQPSEAVRMGEVLVECGFAIIEVPLNSPEPMRSIRLLSDAIGDQALVGAGTVMQTSQVDEVADAGGRLIVMPHAEGNVVKHAKAKGLVTLPGFSTPTEAFAMLTAGADGLKLFPAEANPPAVLKALRAVLPRSTLVFPVGSITPENMHPYLDAGANGFGLGSALYKPGRTAEELRQAARRFTSQFSGGVFI